MQTFPSVRVSASLEKHLDSCEVPMFCRNVQRKSPTPSKCIAQGRGFLKQTLQFVGVVTSGTVNRLIFGFLQACSPNRHKKVSSYWAVAREASLNQRSGVSFLHTSWESGSHHLTPEWRMIALSRGLTSLVFTAPQSAASPSSTGNNKCPRFVHFATVRRTPHPARWFAGSVS